MRASTATTRQARLGIVAYAQGKGGVFHEIAQEKQQLRLWF
jgi:hypothetical protein